MTTMPIESSHPMPAGHKGGDMQLLRNTLSAMRVGQSFIWPKNRVHVYLVAKELGGRICTRKTIDGLTRVWLQKKCGRGA